MVKEEIKGEVKKYLDANEMTTQYKIFGVLQSSSKRKAEGKVLTFRKNKDLNKQFHFTPQGTRKVDQARRKEITNVRGEQMK